ncbi:DUF1684 domain-containing protein [Curtobacterium sp. RRHDQ10]|uniref:DUF1684 domain-containing protein n=1 Tax=Curtobacterium phyllosphaerae TaxID=3413379 RepID=UPI003BF2F834
MTSAGPGSLAEFRAARERAVRAPRGPLALVNAQTVTRDATVVWPVPGRWSPTLGGLAVTATASDGIVVDGIPVDGTVVAAGDSAVVPSSIAFADGRSATIGSVPEGQSLRIWDPAADAIARFARIGVFDPSPEWVVQGAYTPVASGGQDDSGTEGRGTVLDAAGVPLTVAGHIAVEFGDVHADLVAVGAPTFAGSARLQVTFQDATSGDTTYSMGRFLFLDDPGSAGPVVLDFNRAVLPPCAFSYQFACPIPPEQNRLPIAVTAGETRGYDVDGNAVH